MKKPSLIAIEAVMLLILSLGAVSQLGPISKSESSVLEASPKVSLEEKSNCTTEFYSEVRENYGDCTYYNNFTSCVNNSGPNTGCIFQQRTFSFHCKTGVATIQKNHTTCIPEKKFTITVQEGTKVSNNVLDFSDFGPCIRNVENGCLAITCVSNEDGAFNGQFTDCNFGKSCQKTVICENSVRTYYKNAQDNFVEEDPTFFVEKMRLREVG
ncbi:TPA: hypothetical protein HA295_00830 [Candidatus Woesearchaeota archaeon]|nr:MAG: hypothetical protein QT04_C0001G0006 [archaeon GW2011_AR11]HII65303.1 hypothetical protein [Candidatus Woesearchaeota archaeon]